MNNQYNDMVIDKIKLINAIKKDSEMGCYEANKIASKVIWHLEKEIAGDSRR